MADYLDQLARAAADTRLDAIPESTVTAAKLVLLDTLGAIVAGSALPENTRLARLAAERAPRATATLLGHRLGADAFWTALVNATAGVALEVDEGNRLGGGHPAIHVLPGALAVAEEQALDGRRLLEALVAGYEIASRLGTATTVRPNVHSHGTWGTIGTAVAVARLADTRSDVLRATINLAASMSPANSWTPAIAGATIRNLYPGRSAWQGILAVDLHRCGFTGLSDAPGDVYGTILAERFDAALATSGLDRLGRQEPHRIEQNYFKLHACCRYNHFALDAVLALRARHRIVPDDVVAVDVTTLPFGLRMADPAPTTTLAAKFSIPYAVAAALVLGHADVAAFAPPPLEDARLRELARRVRVHADPLMSPRRVDGPTARVRVALRDGSTVEESVAVPRGDAGNPVAPDEIEAKFSSLATPVVGPEAVAVAIDLARRLDDLKDVRQLTAALRPR